jgi:hypothetical protein
MWAVVAQQYSVWLRAGWSGFDPWQGQRIFLLAPVSRPALGHTQLLIQWVPKGRPGRDADHSPPCSAEVKYELSMSAPLCLHGI